MIETLTRIPQWMAAHPYWCYGTVAAVAFLESLAVVGLVFPGALIMFGAGALVASGAIGFWPTFVVAALGAAAGDAVSFRLGRHYGDRVSRLWPFRRHPALLARGKRFFLRHGSKSIVLGRFVGPVRPLIPMIAGVLNMPPGRFYVTNILSALGWAPAYLLPGMAFGWALSLAGEVAGRLAVLICLVMATMLTIVWLVRTAHRYLLPRLPAWAARLTLWSRRHHGAGRLVAGLLDPTRRPHWTLAAWFAILVGATWLFFGVLEDVLTHDQLVDAGHSVYVFLQHLRTPLADRVMVVLSQLGDAAVTAPVIIAVAAWLALRRAWRDLAYWLATIAFGVAIVVVLKWSLHTPRPVPLYLGVSAYAFPSGHTVMSVVVYGFLATLVAPALSPRMRLVLYASIGLFVGGVAFSRLYLGAHWLADVIAGVGIAGTWIALLAIARRRHVPETVGDLPLGVLVAAVFTFAGSWHVYTRFHSDLERYALRAPIQYVAFQNWWTGAWHNLPARRIDLGGEREEPLNVQYAGDLAALRQRLLALGWHEPLQLSAGTALRWLMPSPSVDQLPLLPKLHGGRLDALHLVYRYQDSITGATEHLVLRLWPTQVRLQPGDIPLWIGFVGRLRVWRLPLLSFIRSNGGHDSALELLEPAFPSQPVIREIQRAPAGQARQSPWGGRVLLVHL